MSTPSPGRINAHTHIYSGLCSLGMPPAAKEPKDLREILKTVWWRLDRALDHAILAAAARYYVAESLLAGTTALVDHHESPECIEGSLDVIADACEELGMRAVLCYGATERNGGRDEARRGLEECRRFIARNGRPLVRGVVGVHAAFTVSDESLREAGELARELGTVVHIHVAEDVVDDEDATRRGYDGVLQRLLALDALPPGSILAHGVHLPEPLTKECEERGFWLVQNPRSNRGNRVGYPAALYASERVALGTDGYPADMIDEAELLLFEAAAHGEDLDVASARLDAGHALLAERFGPDLPAAEVTLGQAAIGGRGVIEDGRLVSGDAGLIRREAEQAALKLWKRMA